MSELRPVGGRCLIRVDETPDEIGGIYLPEEAKINKERVGVCVAWMPYAQDLPINKITEDLVGKRVLCQYGVEIKHNGDTYWTVPLEGVIAIMDGKADAEILTEIPRCRWCKSKGKSNLLLDNHGFCIQCKRNRKGQRREDMGSERLSDEEKYQWGRTGAEMARDADPKRKRESKRGISYAGQTRKDWDRDVDREPFEL